MRWAKAGAAWGNAKWHLADPAKADTYEGYDQTRRQVRTECGRATLMYPTWLPEDRRPALARNNVCAACKKAYLKTRPDLQGYFDRLNDKKDI